MSFSDRRRSISTSQMGTFLAPPTRSPTPGNAVPKKKHFSFRNLFSKHGHHSNEGHRNMNESSRNNADEDINQRRSELNFTHLLMQSQDEIMTPNCVQEVIKTVCFPAHCSKMALDFDKKLYQVDVLNGRINTMDHLSITALVSSDISALRFLGSKLEPLENKRKSLWRDIDKMLSVFIHHPEELKSNPGMSAGSQSESNKVRFQLSGNFNDEDEGGHELYWKDCTQEMSADSSSDSEADAPTPQEVKSLARQIRKDEVTRFKHHKGKHKNETSSAFLQPPPPNPLGCSNRAILRANASIPAGLCQQGNQHSSASSLSIHDQLHNHRPLSKHGSHLNMAASDSHFAKGTQGAALPFNLLSLTAQLTWLISEYLEHGSSTYKWALELVGDISKMSVTKSTWLNLHQQLRVTTESLYNHSSKDQGHHASSVDAIHVSVKGEAAWRKLLTIYTSIVDSESTTTITAIQARSLLANRDSAAALINTTSTPTLVPLSTLLEYVFHLDYICDLVLWQQYRNLTFHQSRHPYAVKEHQLLDFKIRSLQSRLDESNFQNWTPCFIDFIVCWLADFQNHSVHSNNPDIDQFCIHECALLRNSVAHFDSLVKEICQSDFMDDNYWTILGEQIEERYRYSPTGRGSHGSSPVHRSSQESIKHGHLLRHGVPTDCLTDLRPMDTNQCSHTYSELIRQMRHHAVRKRPLSYFAKRILYGIAIELDCHVNWKVRLTSIMSELSVCYAEWERLLKHQIHVDF